MSNTLIIKEIIGEVSQNWVNRWQEIIKAKKPDEQFSHIGSIDKVTDNLKKIPFSLILIEIRSTILPEITKFIKEMKVKNPLAIIIAFSFGANILDSSYKMVNHYVKTKDVSEKLNEMLSPK